MNGIHRHKIPCNRCLNDLEARRETGGYVLLYCPHNRAGLITSRGKPEDKRLDVVLSPVDEKQFRNTVVSVLLNNALKESKQMERILHTCEMKGKSGSA